MDGWMILFGGIDPETGVSRYCDAFPAPFWKKERIAAWEAVGAVPCNQACLSNETVWNELGDAGLDDAMQIAMINMQIATAMACVLLTACGFNDNFLKTALKKKKKEIGVRLDTVPHKKEHVEALVKTSTLGAIFTVTSEDHFTSDDMFKAA